MAFVTTQPENLAFAAETSRASALQWSGNTAAAAPTTGVVRPAADEVSALTAAQRAAQLSITTSPFL